MTATSGAGAPHSLRQAFRPIRYAVIALAAFSLGINVLMLVSPLYLMQVFDRVLTSGSLHTLLWLTVVALGSLAIYGVLEVIRSRVLSKMSLWLGREVTGRLIAGELARRDLGSRPSVRGLRDLAQVQGFLSGSAVHAVFDAPWGLLFLGVLWMLHPWFGVFALVSMAVLLGLAWIGEVVTRDRSDRAAERQTTAMAGVEAAIRNFDVVRAMGMVGSVLRRWRVAQRHASREHDALNDSVALVSGLSKFIRIAVQTAVIGIGAVLVVKGEATGGGMIAASILLGRALAPVDQAIGAWKHILTVRAAWQNVDEALRAMTVEKPRVALPEPKGQLQVEDVTLQFPGASEPALSRVSFALEPGQSLAIIGPSAAGKSLLCRVIAGIVAPTSGHVRIDHADLTSWGEDDLRPHVGYLPQEIALFPGTVGENVARLGDASSQQIVAAARLAGVHELILRLPAGYQTDIGEFGHLLSGGQRQRIGLARAVFGAPRLVILDEPNSNLDPAGEKALTAALAELKARGCTVIVVSHNIDLVRNLDRTLLIRDGKVQAFGPSERILSMVAGPRPERAPASAASGRS